MLLNYEPLATDAFRLFDRLADSAARPSRTGMPMDVCRLDDHFVASFDLPGVDPGSIDVTVEGNTLTVRAERSAPHDAAAWLVSERPRGTFSRQLMLGRSLDTDQLAATYRDGVLTVTIPVAERAKPRRIAIAHDAEPQALTANAGG
ncbi:Hsp20/alpha crystallin family protein [Pseudonocardia acidicola]|uniref:Hsp20/alpha crystallin family protein n=1 Tax=Pseudonocardia acidicola TaxID=2724939 RepID=A0ABX1S6T6_9PSEU|nr:Hsp20/alpha crystallin family protein [Pseudonocardia acidicola]NMH95959.1 Hsp20/alpha crystallin family protein [Pseudonocardia acidicola]